jgi:hypothetical protein
VNTSRAVPIVSVIVFGLIILLFGWVIMKLFVFVMFLINFQYILPLNWIIVIQRSGPLIKGLIKIYIFLKRYLLVTNGR